MPLPGGIGLLIELVECCAIPDGALIDLEILIVAIQGDGVGRVGLDLDGIGTTCLGRAYRRQRRLQGVAMVGRQFGDDEAAIRIDGARHGLGHECVHSCSVIPISTRSTWFVVWGR
ncbi:hypothetical protein D3C80_1768450 [compost metagenome]